MTKPFSVATLMVLMLAGCNGALWGNLVVLMLTVGIFFGTLSLGRAQEPGRSSGGTTQTR